jgi:hypothetical protein
MSLSSLHGVVFRCPAAPWNARRQMQATGPRQKQKVDGTLLPREQCCIIVQLIHT